MAISIIFQEPGTDVTGDLSNFSGNSGAASSDTGVFHTAPRSLKLNTGAGPTTAFVNKDAVLADAGRRIGCFFNFSNFSAANVPIVLCRTSGAVNVFTLVFLTTAKLRINAIGAGTVDGLTTLNNAQWYHIGIGYTIASTTSFNIRLYLDGVLEATIKDTGTLTTTVTSQILWEAASTMGANCVLNFDDFYIDDATDVSCPPMTYEQRVRGPRGVGRGASIGRGRI